MRSKQVLQRLAPTPLSLAGYLIWALVALDIWRSGNDSSLLEPQYHLWTAALGMLSFLCAFALRAWAFGQGATSVSNGISVAVAATSALVLLYLGPSAMTPALLVVIAAMVGALYR